MPELSENLAAICAVWGLPAEGATLTFRGMWDLDAGNRRICFAEVPGLAGLRGDQGEEAARRIRFHLDNPHHRHKDGGRCWNPLCGRARLMEDRMGGRDTVTPLLQEVAHAVLAAESEGRALAFNKAMLAALMEPQRVIDAIDRRKS